MFQMVKSKEHATTHFRLPVANSVVLTASRARKLRASEGWKSSRSRRLSCSFLSLLQGMREGGEPDGHGQEAQFCKQPEVNE